MIEPSELKKIINESTAIIIIAALLGFCVNLVHPRGYIFSGKELIRYKNIINISEMEAKIKFDGQTAIFIDSRARNEYNQTRIKDAINIPAQPDSASFAAIKKNFRTLEQPKEIVIYCDENCNSSEVLAKRLIDAGYSRYVYVISRGLTDWINMGFPIEKPEEKGEN